MEKGAGQAPVESAAGAGGAAPESTGYDGWLSEAGFKQLPDASEVRVARDFYSKYGGESELYTKAQLEEQRKTAISEYISNPDTYQRLRDYFAKALGGEAPKPSQNQSDDPYAQQLDTLRGELAKRLDSHESVLAELLQVRQQLTKQSEMAGFQRQFTETVRGLVKQVGGKWPAERLEREVMRRYAAGEIPEDASPQALAKAVKGIVGEWTEDRNALLQELSGAGLIRSDRMGVSPDRKLTDVLTDTDERDRLLEQIINHGLPDGE